MRMEGQQRVRMEGGRGMFGGSLGVILRGAWGMVEGEQSDTGKGIMLEGIQEVMLWERCWRWGDAGGELEVMLERW